MSIPLGPPDSSCPVGRSTGYWKVREEPFKIGSSRHFKPSDKAGGPGHWRLRVILWVCAKLERLGGSQNLTQSHCWQDWASRVLGIT